ncbi:hypothetical protein DPMN_172696 [Dreissena polymorpha]|uniref:Uncharacterized protein n=1 Tax=Dreissena polymorpha TaxID=45954 RepID=A0A9D4IEV2_DREPO|nr:hypothetical protein DPMN_172696 [Dreissena polymorpha]
MCSVDSVPNSTYTWDTGQKGSILTILNVTRTTNTRHDCTANNVMDTSFKGVVFGSNSFFANLDILCKFKFTSLRYNNLTPIEYEFKVIEGSSFTILCSANKGDVLTIRNVRTDMERNVTLLSGLHL